MLRALPAVDRLAQALCEDGVGRAEAVSAARAVLAERRGEIAAGARDEPDLAARARERLRPSLRRVLNGTGVVIHTNLGRAPLAPGAVDALTRTARGYANLELDLSSGRRGSRQEHVRALLCELTGAQDALVVNNGAAAALLAMAALAGRDGAAIVSRGQLVEIGGGFRIPEVVAHAGARLIEVGTTNRTRLADYKRALTERPADPEVAAARKRAAAPEGGAGREPGARVILRVHQSNFRTVGFVHEVSIEELCSLGAPVIDDLGSGVLAAGLPALGDEPSVRRSVAAGAALACFSADKLLGGPQGGILVGGREPIAACRRHPLARALRIGRLPLAALEGTLALYRDPERALREIPVLAMLDVAEDVLAERAERLARATGAEVVQAVARVGGGALPLLELRGPAVALPRPADGAAALAARLRASDPPLISRIAGERVLVDPRTLTEDELELAARVIQGA